MKNIGGMLKQAQQLQSKMTDMQKQMQDIEIVGESGAGMVQITLSGKYEMRRIKIDPKLVDPDEIEMMEDLIIAACNDARGKVEARMKEEMSKLTGGMSLPPGMKLPF